MREKASNMTYLRSFLTFSISAGSLSAKVSLRDCKTRLWSVRLHIEKMEVVTCLGLASRVAAHTVQSGSLDGRLSQRGTERRASQSQRGGHCDDILIK